jgi:hypothetical protein
MQGRRHDRGGVTFNDLRGTGVTRALPWQAAPRALKHGMPLCIVGVGRGQAPWWDRPQGSVCTTKSRCSAARFDYSALGESASTARTLAHLSEHYGVSLLTTENTANRAPEFSFLEIDSLRLRGLGAANSCLRARGSRVAKARKALSQANCETR